MNADKKLADLVDSMQRSAGEFLTPHTRRTLTLAFSAAVIGLAFLHAFQARDAIGPLDKLIPIAMFLLGHYVGERKANGR